MSQRSAIVCGAGGFIGNHLVRRLKAEKYYVVGVDLKFPTFGKSEADLFLIGDLREPSFCERMFRRFDADEVYQLAADMGGAGYLFTGEHDADVLRHSSLIHLNILDALIKTMPRRVFFSSSACVYPIHHQLDSENVVTAEDCVYPAQPDSDYGWEKLFAERLYLAHSRNYGLDVRIARLHNVYGPENPFRGGREKVLGALCRKIAEAKTGDEIEVWGNGSQSRSFLYISECIEGIRRLMSKSFVGPVNLGSSEQVTIEQVIHAISSIAEKEIRVKYREGPIGVQARVSDNRLLMSELGWAPKMDLREGLEITYAWVNAQVHARAPLKPRSDSQPVMGEVFYDFFR